MKRIGLTRTESAIQDAVGGEEMAVNFLVEHPVLETGLGGANEPPIGAIKPVREIE